MRHQAKLEEIRDKYESALKQVREELEAERQGHTHLNTSVNKIKKVCIEQNIKLSFLCDCSVDADYFTWEGHGFCYHLLEFSNTINRPLGILVESSKSFCISRSVNIPSGSLNFENSSSLSIVIDSNSR